MNSDFLGAALTRVQVSRYRKRPDFQAQVEQALQHAVTQPFGKPLDVARAFSFTKVVERRAVWGEVVERLEKESPPPLPPPAARAMPRSVIQPGSVRYQVGLLTDAGPDSAAAVLRDMAAEGRAQVEVLRQGPRTPPSLIYHVLQEHASSELETLRYEEENVSAADAMSTREVELKRVG